MSGYVTFSSSGIHVDLNRFLKSKAGKELIAKCSMTTSKPSNEESAITLLKEFMVVYKLQDDGKTFNTWIEKCKIFLENVK